LLPIEREEFTWDSVPPFTAVSTAD